MLARQYGIPFSQIILFFLEFCKFIKQQLHYDNVVSCFPKEDKLHTTGSQKSPDRQTCSHRYPSQKLLLEIFNASRVLLLRS